MMNYTLTQGQEYDLERVQKVALRIILDEDYQTYENSLFITGLKSLKDRRTQLSLNFALKCTKNERSQDMFPLKPSCVNTRNPELFKVSQSRTSRLFKSAIPSMQRQLNNHAKLKK